MFSFHRNYRFSHNKGISRDEITSRNYVRALTQIPETKMAYKMAFQVDSCRGFSGMTDIFRTFPIKTTDKSQIYTNKIPNNNDSISISMLLKLVRSKLMIKVFSKTLKAMFLTKISGYECRCKTYSSQSVSFKRIFNWSTDKLNSQSGDSWSKSISSYQFSV